MHWRCSRRADDAFGSNPPYALTISDQAGCRMVGTAQVRLCKPYGLPYETEIRNYFRFSMST
jgi:hypothetical protein